MENAENKFPKWKPNRYLLRNGMKKEQVYKKLRVSCLGFTGRKDVRDIIFSRDGHKCAYCGSLENLTIDHIYEVRKAVGGAAVVWELKYYIGLNSYENLITACRSCNSKKAGKLWEL